MNKFKGYIGPNGVWLILAFCFTAQYAAASFFGDESGVDLDVIMIGVYVMGYLILNKCDEIIEAINRGNK